MVDWKHVVTENLPFVLAASRVPVGQEVRINTSKVLESLIIAGITGAIVMYGVQQKLDTQMAELKVQMAELKARMNEDRAESIVRDRRLEDRLMTVQPPGRPR